jgi:hypothetical protein
MKTVNQPRHGAVSYLEPGGAVVQATIHQEFNPVAPATGSQRREPLG